MEYYVLLNGVKIPKVGIGTNTFGKENNVFQADITMDTKELVDAIDNGYRLIDTAISYRNEAVIGKAIKESGLARDQFFVTTKISTKDAFAQDEATIESYLQQSFEKLGLDIIDLYLIHHPSSDEVNLRVWKVLETYYQKGQLRAIGVSNFTAEQLTYLMKHGSIKPMVNQIESNPVNFQHEIISFCLTHQILPQAWSPLKRIEETHKAVLSHIGEKYHKSWAQVLLRYQIQRGVCVIPKSHHKARQKENIDIFDFELTNDEIALIEG